MLLDEHLLHLWWIVHLQPVFQLIIQFLALYDPDSSYFHGLNKVLEAARQVQVNNPELLQPIADFFNIDIDERLENPSSRQGLIYEEY